MERREGGLVTGHPLLRLKKFNCNSAIKNLCTPYIPYIPYSIYMRMSYLCTPYIPYIPYTIYMRVSNLSSNHLVMEVEV